MLSIHCTPIWQYSSITLLYPIPFICGKILVPNMPEFHIIFIIFGQAFISVV
jgi:hypothetical protein